MSGLFVSLSLMSLRLSKMSDSDKCLAIELFCGSECSDKRVAKFLSVLPI